MATKKSRKRRKSLKDGNESTAGGDKSLKDDTESMGSEHPVEDSDGTGKNFRSQRMKKTAGAADADAADADADADANAGANSDAEVEAQSEAAADDMSKKLRPQRNKRKRSAETSADAVTEAESDADSEADAEHATDSDVQTPSKITNADEAGNAQGSKQHTNLSKYDKPFVILYRQLLQEWNKDKDAPTPYDIFPVTGERRKREVKDNFDWLQPVTRPAEQNAIRETYDSNYNFRGGFYTSDNSLSNSKYVPPKSLRDRYTDFTTISMPLDHQFCQIEQPIDWLAKPVGNLLNRIDAARTKPPTRSSLTDAAVGQDIFLCSAYVNADEFINTSDDVELMDFVVNDPSKKIWHCSHLAKSDMLFKACYKGYIDVVKAHFPDALDEVPDWLKLVEKSEQVQFLGLVSLYQSKSGNKVIAFRLHSFLLYTSHEIAKKTEVLASLTELNLTATTLPVRMLQILQMVQCDLVKSTSLLLKPQFILPEKIQEAYTHLGFLKTSTMELGRIDVYSRNTIIKLIKFSNRILWARYGNYISMEEEVPDGSEHTLNMYCRIVSELFLRPTDPITSLGRRFKDGIIRDVLTSVQSSTQIHRDIDTCAKTIRAIAAAYTRIPISVVTHAIVRRVLEMKGENVFFETTLELLQDISIAMETAVPYHEVFVGDCHTCVLYCEKCLCRFGNTGNIFQVLAESTNAILYHHGLELPITGNSFADDDNDLNTPLKDARFQQSLPIHCLPLCTGELSYRVLSSLNPELDRCKYGNGMSLSIKQQKRNFQYLHNLAEAMRIDTFSSGGETMIQNRRICTSSLIFSVFDVAHQYFQTKTASKDRENLISFEDYAREVVNALETGNSWIQSRCAPRQAVQHRVLVGWSYVLSQQFLLNYAYLCQKLHQITQPTFSVYDLLAKIGLDNRFPQLLSICLQYSMTDLPNDFYCVLCDKESIVPITTCTQQRPLIESVEDSNEDRGTISKLGKGWDHATCSTWFAKKKDKNDGTGKDATIKQYRMAQTDRKISSSFEAEETSLIMRTLHSVTLDYESDTLGRGYSMTCKVDDLIKKKPGVLVERFKEFFAKPTFECSNCMITSLPLNFVKTLRVGKSSHLPKEWKAAVRKDAILASSSCIATIQLWRSHRHIAAHEKMSVTRIYRATYQNADKSTRIAYITEKIATQSIRSEPWIIDDVRALCTVRSYRQVAFGEGAKTSCEVNGDKYVSSVKDNFWYSTDNHAKLCTEGAVANMLFHMNLQHAAEEFRALVTAPVEELLANLKEKHVPKRVCDGRKGLDPLEKCMWILEKKYDCRRFLYLNPDRHKSVEKLLLTLNQIRLPVLISVLGQHSIFNHVVVVWRGSIIDFETRQPYPLTTSNIESICGPKNPFMKLTRGYIILPSRKMKTAVGDFSDWGEKEIRTNLMHLFRKNV